MRSFASLVLASPLQKLLVGLAAVCGACVMLGPTPSAAQSTATVQGQVIDAETGNPLVGANVQVLGTQRGTSADTDGQYSVRVAPGDLRLRASFVGYSAGTEQLRVEAGETYTLNFELAPGSTLDDVVVVGSRGESRSALQSAVPVDALPVDELTAQSPQTNLNRLLTYSAPSFQANRQSAADATEFIDPASLRGLPPDQVLVLVNGKRRHKSSLINTLQTAGNGAAGTDLNAIPTAAVEQIEVLRNGAAAQYGSDAIAGVLNVQLKEDTDRLTANVTSGIHQEGDGELLKVEANYGFGLGEDGFVNVTGTYRNRARTNRSDGNQLVLFDQSRYLSGGYEAGVFAYPLTGNPEQARQNDQAILDQLGMERKDFNFRVGQSAIEQGAVFLNSEVGLNDDATFYAFGGLSYKNGVGAPFRRLPYETANMPYRPDAANPAFEFGFQPEMNSDVIDQSLTLGVKGTIAGWTWDLANSFGRNSLDYQMDNTANASLLQATPSSIYAGKHAFSQNTSTLDVSRFFDDALAGVNVAFGGAYRVDHYQIFAGEEASYRNYGRTQMIDNSGPEPQLVTRDTLGKAGGAQGFVGFRPENEVDRTRSNVAAYLDTEVNLTDELLVTAAGRFEEYSDFGNTLTGKLAARWSLFEEQLNLRGSVSNGFRAPSLHQLYFNQVRTDFNDAGRLVNVGTFSNDSEVARVLGVPRLDEERSRSASVGFTASPTENFDLTVDGYRIRVDDRIVLTGEFSSGVEGLLDEAGASSAQFFANAVDTETIGLDVVATYRLQTAYGTVDLSAAGNYNRTEADDELNIPSTLRNTFDGTAEELRNTFFSPKERALLETSSPRTKLNLSADYSVGPVSLFLRTVRFGEVTRNEFPFGSEQVHSPQWVTDATVSYQMMDAATVSVGANNLFDNYPDEQVPENSYYGVFDYAPVQQGFNGAFYFARLNVQL
ncbi:TonB-dependent receptor [Salinibacter grassmerensis]|uniref:TonB-dependent receptor n=1 Tax=Salinibacter grassmerensis TaxID=3040353 RepID=UPI0021E8E7DF|nr:TonB-dependent receptor [Salinibacter grassmerensis]